mgnify:CR=1 FL=1
MMSLIFDDLIESLNGAIDRKEVQRVRLSTETSDKLISISDIENKYQIEYGVNIRTHFNELGYNFTVSSKRSPLIINGIVSYDSVDQAGMLPVEHLIKDMCRQIKEKENA